MDMNFMSTELKERMAEREMNFKNYVSDQAKELLNEVKSSATTYGEIKVKILVCEQSARWSSPKNPFLLVIAEAKSQLDKEIDATTHSDYIEIN